MIFSIKIIEIALYYVLDNIIIRNSNCGRINILEISMNIATRLFHQFFNLKSALPFTISLVLTLSAAISAFTADEYVEAGWLSLRFYGAQRCGATGNWALADHDPSKGGSVCHTKDGQTANVNLTGGWHDCGDHWKVCFTMGFSAYTLLKAFDVFPAGFTDRYKQVYKYTETMPAPDGDGIPDVINEAKVATDYLIKAIPDENTFYAECGDPIKDHMEWKTSAYQSLSSADKGGDPRPVVKLTDKGGISCAQSTAALAIMARLCPTFGMQAYADSCRAAAIRGYAYAKKNASRTYSRSGFYEEKNEPNDDLIVAASELYFLTKEEKYKTDAKSFIQNKWESGFAYAWGSMWEAAYYNLLKIDPAMNNGAGKTVMTLFKGSLDKGISNKNQGGLSFYDGYGSCRYAGGAAFAMLLLADLTKTSDAATSQKAFDFSKSQVDYILGNNEFKRSFLHGFGSNPWDKVHHRNLHGIDTNPSDAIKESTPFKFKRGGALIGGPSSYNSFVNSVVNYTTTESGCDYNAGITAALAALISQNKPYAAVVRVNQRISNSTIKESVNARLSRTGQGIVITFDNLALNSSKSIEIYNLKGAVLANKTLLSNQIVIPANTVAPGSYLCVIRDQNFKVTLPIYIQ
jgi:hypothetical protein